MTMRFPLYCRWDRREAVGAAQFESTAVVLVHIAHFCFGLRAFILSSKYFSKNVPLNQLAQLHCTVYLRMPTVAAEATRSKVFLAQLIWNHRFIISPGLLAPTSKFQALCLECVLKPDQWSWSFLSVHSVQLKQTNRNIQLGVRCPPNWICFSKFKNNDPPAQSSTFFQNFILNP